MTPASPSLGSPPTAPPRKRSAYVHMGLSFVLTAAAQIFMKLGSGIVPKDSWIGIAGLSSGWVWLGIVAMLIGLASWVYALRFVPLIIAFNLAGLVHVLVPVSCWIFLGEAISARRWCGIVLVVAGVFVIARPLMKVEEKL